MPFTPYSNYLTLIFFAVVLVSALFSANTRIGIIATVIWLVFLVCVYYIAGLNKQEKVEFSRYEEEK